METECLLANQHFVRALARRKTGAFDISPGFYKATIVDFPKSGEKVIFKPIPFKVPKDGLTDLVFRPVRESDPPVGE